MLETVHGSWELRDGAIHTGRGCVANISRLDKSLKTFFASPISLSRGHVSIPQCQGSNMNYSQQTRGAWMCRARERARRRELWDAINNSTG